MHVSEREVRGPREHRFGSECGFIGHVDTSGMHIPISQGENSNIRIKEHRLQHTPKKSFARGQNNLLAATIIPVTCHLLCQAHVKSFAFDLYNIRK